MSNGSRRGDGWPSRISITPSGAAVCSNSDCCDVILVTVVVHIARAGEVGETSRRKTLGTELATVHNAIILAKERKSKKRKKNKLVMSRRSPAMKRIMTEAKELAEPTDQYYAAPLEVREGEAMPSTPFFCLSWVFFPFSLSSFLIISKIHTANTSFTRC